MLELLETLKERNSHKGNGHFRIYGTLTIGHALHPGVQRVQSWPFKDMHYHHQGCAMDVLARIESVNMYWYVWVCILACILVRIGMYQLGTY